MQAIKYSITPIFTDNSVAYFGDNLKQLIIDAQGTLDTIFRDLQPCIIQRFLALHQTPVIGLIITETRKLRTFQTVWHNCPLSLK